MEKMTIKEVAEDLGMDVRTVRLGIKQGSLPFGVAIKNKRWTYHIWEQKYKEWKERNLG